MDKLPTFEEILEKVPTARHAPLENCKYCHGKGFRHKHLKATEFLAEIDADFACICLFVDHDLVDMAQEIINAAAKDVLG